MHRIPARCGLVGTMEFMSPEVVAREEAQAASDMWSVGVLVFMMVGFIITRILNRPFCNWRHIEFHQAKTKFKLSVNTV